MPQDVSHRQLGAQPGMDLRIACGGRSRGSKPCRTLLRGLEERGCRGQGDNDGQKDEGDESSVRSLPARAEGTM